MFFEGAGKGVRIVTEAFGQTFDKILPSDLVTDVRLRIVNPPRPSGTRKIVDPKTKEERPELFQTIYFNQGRQQKHAVVFESDVPELFGGSQVGWILNLDTTKLGYNAYKVHRYQVKAEAAPPATDDPGPVEPAY